jgi:long-chain acyl-CoA synthetase
MSTIQDTDRPWLKHYKSMPADIDPNTYPNLQTILEETLKKYADRPAYVCMDKVMTFREVDKASRDFAAFLHGRGLNPGDKIALMMPNILQYPVALYGVLRAGLIIVNTNPLYTPRELKHQLNDSGAKAIVIIENFASTLEQVIGETQVKTVIVASMGDMLGFIKGTIVNFVVRSVKKMVPAYNIPNTIPFKTALSEGAGKPIKPFTTGHADIVALQYTGGTTGVSKGAMLTNYNLVSNMLQMRANMTTLSDDGNEVAICPLPLYHIFAFIVNAMGLFSMGAKNILIANPRDQKALVKDIKNYPPTAFIGLNTLFNALLNNPEFLALDHSKMKMTLGGGMAVQRAVAEKWENMTGCPVAEGYGMTETSPCATCNPLDGSGKLGTIGIPLPSTYLRIVDDAGNPLPQGEVGEIQIKGPQVMKGYYNRPEATADVIKDGWMCTGDMGLMDEDGYFKIVDRKKDMILVSGFNVYPNEIEDVIAMHPKVLEVACIGVKDDKSGEVPKVFIVPKDPSLTAEEVIEHCRANMTAYKVPRFVEFRTDLPKTNVGKILRRELRDK